MKERLKKYFTNLALSIVITPFLLVVAAVVTLVIALLPLIALFGNLDIKSLEDKVITK